MGYLGCLFSWMHPVRHVGRQVRRAVTPRPIRRVLRAKNQVVHPVSSAERAIFRSVDRAITPRRKPSRKSGSSATASPKSSADLKHVQGELDKLSAQVDRMGVQFSSGVDAAIDAQMAAATPEQRARWMPVIQAQRAGARLQFSPEGHVIGWWVGNSFHPFER